MNTEMTLGPAFSALHYFANSRWQSRSRIGRRFAASCDCGWEGLPTSDVRKSWLGHLRRVGARLPYIGANYGVIDG